MQILIDIPEEIYESSKRECEETDDLIIDVFTLAIGNGTPLPKEHGKLIDADKIKKEAKDWFMYAINSKYNNPKDCVELTDFIIGWFTYAIDKTSTIIEADNGEDTYGN